MIKLMASLKFYIIIILTSFVLPGPQFGRIFTVVDHQGKKEISYKNESKLTVYFTEFR